jgi:hypothetical protein
MLTKRSHAKNALALFATTFAVTVSAAFGADTSGAQARQAPLFLTETNGSTNYLAVINTETQETDYVPTGGNGGAASGSNGGGVAVSGELAAAINYNSFTVTIFHREGNSMKPVQKVTTTSKPLSVAFGHDHLVVLGTTTAESFPVYGNTVGANDGIVQLLIGDGSAGQIITYAGGAIYSEKTGNISLLSLSTAGAPGISGPSAPVQLPAAPNNNTPLGMIARGEYVYATIAHSDLQALVFNGQIVNTAIGPTPLTSQQGAITHAPCWNALSGHFLFSSDSPGMQLVRYLVSDRNIFLDKIGVATLTGAPTDLTVQGNLLGVIDGGNGVNSNVTLFDVSSEGELTQRFALKIAAAINGAAIIR